MPKRIQIIKLEKSTSNSWLLMSLLAIFFFLYQWLVIYTVVTMACTPLEEFWLAPDQLGLNPFRTFIVVFLLFGAWALAEMVSAQIGGYSDRWFCSSICFLVLVCVIAIMATFRMQWEYYEVKWGVRSHQDLTFQAFPMPDEVSIDPWGEFLAKKKCKAPHLFNDIDSEKNWKKLEKEFIDGGGSFERMESSS